MTLTLKHHPDGSFWSDPDEQVIEVLNDGTGVGLLLRGPQDKLWMHVCKGHYVVGFYDDPEDAFSRPYTPVQEWRTWQVGDTTHACGYHPDGIPK